MLSLVLIYLSKCRYTMMIDFFLKKESSSEFLLLNSIELYTGCIKNIYKKVINLLEASIK